MVNSRLSEDEEAILRIADKFGQYRTACPICVHTRSRHNQHIPCLAINRDDARVVYKCHHCDADGIILTGEKMNMNVVPLEKPIVRKEASEAPPLGLVQYEWLNGRGISNETADLYRLFAKRHFFPATGKEEDAVAFPYFDDDGKIVSAKIRSLGSKAFSCWQSPLSFFGIEQVKIGEDLIIVEGEMDVLAFREAGISAVSVPNGAPMKVSDGRISPEEDKKFRFLWAAKDYLEKAKRVIIAVDADGPGEALAEEIARRVGKDKCWRIAWPTNSKDSNDVLLKHGKQALIECLENASAWPVAGLYDVAHFEKSVTELFDKGIGRGASTGYDNVDDLYTVVTGQMTVVTGIPSSGKSEFVDQIMVNLAESLDWKFGVCSFENEPRLHISKLMAKRARAPFFQGYHRRMSQEEFKAALDWTNDHFVFLHKEDGGLSDLDGILDRLRIAVLRFGIRGAIIDPYNFIERPRNHSETEWISDMLTKIKAFVMAHDIHIWFVAHPTKLQRGENGKLPVPKGYDISGSAAWFAKADCGLTVHRQPDENPLEAQIHIWKVRFAWVGKQGETKLYYDTGTTRYNDYTDPEPQASEGKALPSKDIFH